MPWNSELALVEASVKLAKEKHPDGYNKKKLIECSHEVNGGFSTNPLKRIETMEDVNHMGNHMANIDGGYPVGMSGCYVVGINGGCGFSCPVFREGDCETVGEFSLEDFKLDDEQYCKSIEDQYEGQWCEQQNKGAKP